jgi:hypothetical protein
MAARRLQQIGAGATGHRLGHDVADAVGKLPVAA